MKKILLLIFITLAITRLQAQNLYDNNWCFGDSAGLSFSSGSPLPFISSLRSEAACASISDSLGNLLFYTNGINVWDKNNVQMPNGYGLYALSPFPNYGSSVDNGVLILPLPDSANKFIIFTSSSALDTGLNYSIVNMQLNGGSGDVEQKNINLSHEKLYEAITSIRHANGRDWWVLAHKNISDEFYWYLVTPQGVSGPIIQHSGTVFPTSGYDIAGQFDVSKDGTKLLMVTQRSIDVFSIDRCIGVLANYISIIYSGMNYFAIGGAFSSSGNLGYVTVGVDSIFQFNLSDSVDSIYIKRKLIFDNPFYTPISGCCHFLNSIQRGRDNKIYFTIPYHSLPTSVFDSINTKLSVINNPDSVGIACDLSVNSIDLGGRRCFVDLPNMPNYNLGPIDGSACDTLGIDNHNGVTEMHSIILNIYPNPATSELTIEVLNGVKPKEIAITNMLGVTVMQLHQTKPNQQVNIKALAAGVYFVKVQTQDGSVTVKRFVKEYFTNTL